MRWKKGMDPGQKEREYLRRKKNWHIWFAWHPVATKDQWIWLERVMRKGEVANISESVIVHWNYEYRSAYRERGEDELG